MSARVNDLENHSLPFALIAHPLGRTSYPKEIVFLLEPVSEVTDKGNTKAHQVRASFAALGAVAEIKRKTSGPRIILDQYFPTNGGYVVRAEAPHRYGRSDEDGGKACISHNTMQAGQIPEETR